MTPRVDEPVARPVPWRWIATLLAILLFFLLLVVVALHVQRTAERTLAQNHRELSDMAQRSAEVQLATEVLLHEQERRERDSGRPGLAMADPFLALLNPASPEHSSAHGAVSWKAGTGRGQLLVAGLPAVGDPHEYELRVEGYALPEARFTSPEGGVVRRSWTAADGPVRIDSGTIELVLRRRPAARDWIETIVLRSP